jgi:hypothetical protein
MGDKIYETTGRVRFAVRVIVGSASPSRVVHDSCLIMRKGSGAIVA